MTRIFFDWNDEMVTRLKAMHAEGISCGLIADTIGNGLTRTATVKKARRLGLRGKPTKTKCMGPAISVSFARRSKPSGPSFPKPRLIHPDPIGPLEDIVRDGHCKYVHGEPRSGDWRMCGHKTIAGKSWCAFHAEICLVKPTARVA